MPTDTNRVTTPFGAESTAQEVLEGIDLSGKRVIVTGASSGIGVETARALAGAGAEVTLAVRNTGAGERAAAGIARTTDNPSLHVAPLDLADRSSVVAFEPRDGAGRSGAGGYSVRYREHPISPDSDGSVRRRTLTTDRLVLSAGAVGSTCLLLRNRSAFPRISKRLGTRFCGNGDYLTLAVKASKETDGGRVPRVIDPGYGPVITSAVRGADVADGEARGEGRGFYLEDAGFPQHLAWMLQTFGLPGPLWRLFKQRFVWDWTGTAADPRLNLQLSRVLGNTGLSAGVLPMLGMGSDVPDGNMKLRAGKLDVDWNKRNTGPYLDRVREASRQMADALGARFVHDPLQSVKRLVTDLNRLTTVHPLGGCPMGRDVSEGVVDPCGEVFGYPGLYVADGAVMPGPVGANPSLTIAALADRFADGMLEGNG